MRILVDALTAREGGGTTYLTHILPAMRRVAPAHDLHVLLSSRYQSALLETVSAWSTPVAVSLRAADLPRRLYFLARGIPRLLESTGYDALFTVNEVGCVHPTRPHVMLARNYSLFAPLRLFETPGARAYAAAYRLTREPVARAALRRATHVAFVSDAYRRDIVARLGLVESRTSVVHHGVDPVFRRPADAPRIDRPVRSLDTILCVATITPYKNHETLLRAYASASRAASSFPRLLLVGGGEASTHGRQLRSLGNELGIGSRVTFAGRVPHDALPSLYHQALLFVAPSRLETFGQPLLEAMAAGAPILSSDLPVSRELCGSAADYFDPRSPDALADRLRQLVTDADHRWRLSTAALERAASFSWDAAARKTIVLIERAAGSTG